MAGALCAQDCDADGYGPISVAFAFVVSASRGNPYLGVVRNVPAKASRPSVPRQHTLGQRDSGVDGIGEFRDRIATAFLVYFKEKVVIIPLRIGSDIHSAFGIFPAVLE